MLFTGKRKSGESNFIEGGRQVLWIKICFQVMFKFRRISYEVRLEYCEQMRL